MKVQVYLDSDLCIGSFYVDSEDEIIETANRKFGTNNWLECRVMVENPNGLSFYAPNPTL